MNTPITVGSLFAGIGGLDLGLERCGMQVKWQVEIDPWCRRVLAKHWPDVRRHDDIRTWPTDDAEAVDLICGGFPCQDISFAGKGAGLDGERSGLFYELIRVVRVMGPRYVLLENVSALLVRGLDAVLGTLAAVGYDAEWHCVPASHVGAPHIRDRIFIVGHAGSESRERNAGGFSAAQAGERREGTQHGDLPVGSSDAGGRGRERDVPAGDGRGAVPDAGRELLEERRAWDGDGGRRAAIEPCRSAAEWWSVEPDVGRVADGVPRRVDRLRGLGNAVVPQVAEFVGERILKHQHSINSDVNRCEQ